MADQRIFNPPLPDDVSEREFGTAWFWSKRFGLPTNRDSLVTLARLLPPGYTGDRPQDKAWQHVLSQGRQPKRRIVKSLAFFARVGDYRQQQRAKAAALAAHLDFDRLGPEVAGWIGDFLESTGSGPLWCEVGAAFGWDRIHTHAIITALCRAGWVSYTEQTRSLRPTQPEACPQRLRVSAGSARQRGPGRAVARTSCRQMPSQAGNCHSRKP